MTKKVKASSLVLDFNLYPRHQVSEQHVRDMTRAIDAGETLPPLVADKKSRRLTDGWNRYTAITHKHGPDAEIEVEFRDYADEAEMLLDAIAMNSAHGLKLSAYDMARCLTLGQEHGLTPERIAGALRMTTERLTDLGLRKTAIGSDGKMVPIKLTLRSFAGRRVTKQQMEGNKRAVGHNQMFLVNQVINLFEQNILDRTNEPLMERVELLYALVAAERKAHRKAS